MWPNLFPWECLLCADRADGRDLCDACADDLPWWRGPCGPDRPRSFAAFDYRFPVDRLVLHLKFHQGLVAGRVLGELLAGGLLQDPGIRGQRAAPTGAAPTLLIPIPLHTSRLRERGHNQALEIARPVARALTLPLRPRWCRRVRATAPQTSLSGTERADNVAGAFVADARVRGQRVALIDDVYTTGSTAAAATEAMLKAGARSVDFWCVATASSGKYR